MSGLETTTPGTLPRERWYSYSTRTLMVCAALGAAFTVIFGTYTLGEAVILPVAPMVIVFFAGLWFALPLLAMLYIRRIGSAIITAGIAGLLTSFVSPYGWQMLIFTLAYAFIVEIVFAVTAWRRFGLGVVSSVVVVMWLVSLAFYWATFAATGFALWVNMLLGVAVLVAYFLWGLLAWWLARALRRVLPSNT
ncbi:ECF transporter S component [Leucobacter sp. M11]|uniref:ECF transporter S component n=1 Tax=Leucobacter sp. M11 TaxID=2993565 RepID=UPI002D7FEBF3|nr:ECF transporter S component [Leucobacter sp. M11]MEB4613390.1 ECF transporter S component [Leucobacter sp. M11]